MRTWIFPVLLIMGLLLAACSGGTANPPAAPTQNQTTPTAASGTTPTKTAQTTPTTASAGTTPTTGAVTTPTAASATTPTQATSQTGTTPATQGQPVPIGIAVAQTSNVSLFGQDQVAGAKVAEDYFNKNGGINGQPIKLIFQDTAGDEQGAINAFQNLINKDKVVGIVGPTLSQQAFAADPIAVQAKVPVVGPSNTATGIPQIGPYVSRVSAPVSQVAPAALDAALKLNPNIKNVVVMYAQNDAFSKSETQIFQDVLKKKGLNITSVQTFQTTDTDFTTQATNALNEKPDLIVISGLANDSGNLVKQLRELGYKGLIVGGNGLNSPNMFPVCKQYCDGVIVAQAYSAEASNEINNAFKTLYQQQNKKDPGQFGAQAFTGVQVIVDALRAVDSKKKVSSMSLDELRTALNDQLHSGAKYNTPLGDITITKEGEIQQTTFYVAQIKMSSDGSSGQFVLLK